MAQPQGLFSWETVKPIVGTMTTIKLNVYDKNFAFKC